MKSEKGNLVILNLLALDAEAEGADVKQQKGNLVILNAVKNLSGRVHRCPQAYTGLGESLRVNRFARRQILNAVKNDNFLQVRLFR